ncbi:MAG: hypothetical protein H6Q33_3072, partial [Deltaproteobacteria bacterium]|nr:hypothetical protein [Deltaproteobacteria bacterium]
MLNWNAWREQLARRRLVGRFVTLVTVLGL